MLSAKRLLGISLPLLLLCLGAQAQKLQIENFIIGKSQIKPAGVGVSRDSFWNMAQSEVGWYVTWLPHTNNLGLLILPEAASTTRHVFEIKFSFKQDGDLDYIGVNDLATFTYDDIKLDSAVLAHLDFAQIGTLCKLVDADTTLPFLLIPVLGDFVRPPAPAFFDGIVTQRIPCSQASTLVRIHNRNHLEVYKEDRIGCLPPGFSGALLAEVKASGDTTWFRPGVKKDPVKKKPAEKPADGKAGGDKAGGDKAGGDKPDIIIRTSFPFTCDNNKHDFCINLFRDGKGNIEYLTIYNRFDRRQASRERLAVKPGTIAFGDYILNMTGTEKVDSLILTGRDENSVDPPDTLMAMALTEVQRRYILQSASGLDSLVLKFHANKKGDIDSLAVGLYRLPLHRYNYDSYFDQGSFERWLKSWYRQVSDLCASSVANAVRIRDTTLLQYEVKPDRPGASPDQPGSSKDTAKTGSKDKPSPAASSTPWIKPGTVTIPKTAKFMMTPGTLRRYIRVPLQLNVKYDSSACQVQFKMKFGGLANGFKLVDTAVLISQKAWDSAMAFRRGRMDVELAFRADVAVDSLSSTQEDYLVINDSTSSGYLPVELRNSLPDADFWLELGTNFELLDGIKPQNIYAGILLFDKEITHCKIFGRNHYISLIAGAYESKTSSTVASGDSGIFYRDNRSYLADSLGRYPVFHDTGTVSVTSSSKNIGLIFEPAISLTTTPNRDNGIHVSLALYNELLWSTVTTSNDYSRLGKDSLLTQYVSKDAMYKYRFKQNTAVTEDYRTSYIGIGLPIYLKRNSFTFFFNPVFGWTNQKFTPIRPQADPTTLRQVYKYPQDSIISGYPVPYLQPRCSWNPFYIAQFRFNEEKYDITITGDIRVLALRSASPLVTLSLSKKFDLSALVKTIGSIMMSKPSNN